MNYSRYRQHNDNKEFICAQCSGELTKKEMSTRLCPCGFQICFWCLSKILQDKAACPECGRSYSHQVYHLLDNYSESQYSDSSSSFSNEQDKKRNTLSTRLSQSDINYLQNVRIIQKNLVYIIGLAPSITEENTIRSQQLFGQYGVIKKVILNNSPQLIEKVHSCCAYITYSKPQEALDCIMATDGCVLHGCQIRSSFGTTKYCNFFLRGSRCTNSECMYLHHLADEEDCFTKKEMQIRQAEFFAKTHPCHSDMTEVPMGEDLSVLPPAPNSRKETVRPFIKNSFCSVFGNGETSQIDCSSLLTDHVLMEHPFQTERVLASDSEIQQALNTMMAEECVTCLASCSMTSIDLSFLLKADDYLKRVQKQGEQPVDNWDWHQVHRSYSIDSNTSVDV